MTDLVESPHPAMQDINESMFDAAQKFPASELRLGNAPGPLRAHLPNPGSGIRVVEAAPVTFYRLGFEELKLQPYLRLPSEESEMVPAKFLGEEVSAEEVLVQALITFRWTPKNSKFTDKWIRDVLISSEGDIFGRAEAGVMSEEFLQKIGYIARPDSLMLGSVAEGYVQPPKSLFEPTEIEKKMIDRNLIFPNTDPEE